MNIENKVAVVTGGASGLGEATVRRYAEAGAKVAIFDLNQEAGQALADELGDAAVFCAVDVVDEASATQGVEHTLASFGQIHICNNFAGISPGCKTVGRDHVPHPLEKFRQTIDINLIGTFNVLRLCASQMSKQDSVTDSGTRGVIINTGSIAGYEGQIGQAAYAASKGAIIGMTLCLARDLAQYGIRVNTIVPGLIHTPLFESFPDPVVESLEASVLYPKRLGKPQEIAHLSQYIVENDYTNGECIRMDGGLRMQPR